MKLIIAEKKSAATDLKNAIKQNFVNGQGFFKSDEFIITWAYGHLVNSLQPSEYEDFGGWKWDAIPFYPPTGELDYAIPNKTDFDKVRRNQLSIIKKLYKENNITTVYNACDAEREGELIFWEIYNFLKLSAPVKRLWINAWVNKDILESLNNPKDEVFYEPRKDASFARQYADWLLGHNLTVAMSVKHNHLLHVGRVQTPTLALLVNRRNAIENFKPETYYELDVEFGNKYKGKWYKDAKGNTKLKTTEEVKQLNEKIKNKQGIIIEKQVAEQKENPKRLFDLSSLQRECNSRFGYTAKKTLDIAQQLYDKYKLTSYPRTDSEYLKNSQVPTFNGVLNSLKVKEYEEYVDEIISLGIPINKSFVDDVKVSDHHAIIPTEKKVDWNQFESDKTVSKEELVNVYDLIVRRFLSVFLPAAEYEKTDIVTEIEGETFKTSGRILKNIGWKKLFKNEKEKDKKKDEDIELPPIEKGESYDVSKTDKLEKQTKPPSHYNDSSIIAAMVKAKDFVEDEDVIDDLSSSGTGMELGTVATRADTIESLINRKYALRKGKQIIATDLGVKLIEVAPKNLKTPEVTATWEMKLKKIERNEYSYTNYKEEINTYVSDEIKSIKGMSVDVVFESRKDQNVVGVCPKCNKSIIEYEKGVACASSTKEHSCFKFWKIVAKKKLTQKNVKELIEKGITSTIKGLTSTSGRKFEAKLRLKSDYDGLEFVFNEEVITDCPKCGKEITNKGKFFSCETNTKESPCTIGPSEMYGKTLTIVQLKQLIETGSTDYIKFKSKKGVRYEARVVFKNDKYDFEFKPRMAEKTELECPECGKNVIERDKVFNCEDSNCKFVIFKNISGKNITKEIVEEILGKEQTEVIDGFTSKAGKPFEASLKYDKEKNRVTFVF